MICGFDYEILTCDFNIQQVQIEIGTAEQQMENVEEKVCDTVGKCWKHSGWQKLKTIETEIHLQELVFILINKLEKKVFGVVWYYSARGRYKGVKYLP